MNIPLISGQLAKLHVKLETEDDFELYGGTTKDGFSITPERPESKNEWLVTIDELEVAGKPLTRFDIYVRQLSSGREWVVLSGKLLVSPRSAGVEADKLAPVEYNVTIPVVENAVDLTGAAIVTGIPGPRGWSAYEIAVQNGFVGSEPEWLEHMRQQTATLAVEQVSPLMERAELAAEESEQSANDADEHKKAAQAAQQRAENEATRSKEAADKAEQHENTVRGLIADAAAHEQAAAQSALDALANQQSAEQAAQDAALAQKAAQTAKTDAEAAMAGAQTAEGNAKASANAASADKLAAEQAKTDAQAAQSTAEEQAAIATKAAEDAQAPESIAAQAARPATMVLVKDELLALLGDASLFDIDTDGQRIVVHTDRLADDKLAVVEDMLGRFVPQFIEVVRYNQSIDIPWSDWQYGLRQVDWIGADGNQKVETDLYLDSSSRIETLIKSYGPNTYRNLFDSSSAHPNRYTFQQQYERVWIQLYGSQKIYSIHYSMPDSGTDIAIEMEKGKTWLNGVDTGNPLNTEEFECTAPAVLFAAPNGGGAIVCTIGYLRIFKNGVLARNYIPAVDELGNGCLYDTVTRAAKFSTGTRGLIHPEQETEVATYSLRKPIMYAQLTEHGVRRLYHVPDGCELSKEEYAAAYGFKPLVELPQPEEGYWSPRWRETEDELVLEWVETEPPMDEFGLPEEDLTNN